MYQGGQGGGILSSAVITGGGAVALPFTGGNHLGQILALVALSIGTVAILSQLLVRAIRRFYL